MVVSFVSPQETDQNITRFTENNVVVYRATVAPTAPLLAFLPGTHGKPENLKRFLTTAAIDGYRAIGLMYDDADAVNVICPSNPNPSCSALVRRKRIYGVDDTNLIDDRPVESIVNRLVKLLLYLNAQHPRDGWNRYLSDGAPDWSHIAIGGHSQGAGMAAFIAKEHAVARVLLFSSPWDFHVSSGLSPWLRAPSSTPSDRWFAAYHIREPMARLIVRALSLEPQAGKNVARFGAVAYHMSVVGDYTTPLTSNGTPEYLSDWLFLLGSP